MTVSRALNPRHHNRMRSETRERILAVVKKLNYVTDPAARRLKRRKTDVLTLVVGNRFVSSPEILDLNPHFDDLSWGIVRGAIAEARKYNYELKIEAVLGTEENDKIISHLQPHLTDGVILVGDAGSALHKHLRKQGLPVVTAQFSEGKECEGRLLMIDREEERQKAYQYLLEIGRESIAFLGCDMLVSSRYFLNSFKSFFSAVDIFKPELVYSVSDLFEHRELLGGFVAKLPFDAIVCCNDTMADFTIRELRYHNIRVPEDVAIIGQDGNAVYMKPDRSNPATIVCPWSKLAAESVATLIGIIEHGKEEGNLITKIPAYFSKGQTV